MSAHFFSQHVFTVIVSLVIFLAALPTTIQAQSILEAFTADLTLEATPQYPAPGENVRFSVQSLLFDLTTSDISWYANEGLVAEGVGTSGVTLTAGPLGSETTIRVEVRKEGASAATFGAIRPTALDLLWEADSYVPPFYTGRALPSAGSGVRFFVAPHFQIPGTNSLISPNELVYTWRKNGKIISSISGKGRHTVLIEGPVLFGSDTVSVEVKTADHTLQGGTSVRIASVEPSIVLYEEHPVFGVLYHRAITEGDTLPETEVTFTATPYYAPVRNRDTRNLLFEWRVNRVSVVNNPTRPHALTLNATGSSGNAFIELVLTHATNFFLRASKAWNITISNSIHTPQGDPFRNSNE